MLKQKIARWLFHFHGWRLIGKPVPPEAERCMFVFAPHTSNWDFYYGMLAMAGWGLPVKVAIKDSWTKIPVIGAFIKYLGGVGIDRSGKSTGGRNSQVYKLAAVFERYERIAFVITPEGSRSRRTKWKPGFYQIAKLADVPMVTLRADFPGKTVEYGPVFYPQQELETIMREMMVFYEPAVGKYPELFALDERYV